MLNPIGEARDGAAAIRESMNEQLRRALLIATVLLAVIVTLLVSIKTEGLSAEASAESERRSGGEAVSDPTDLPSRMTAATARRGDIVFVRSDAGVRELSILDPKSGRISRLGRDTGGASNPSWSPSRTRIAFYGQLAGFLFLVRTDGKGLRHVPDLGIIEDETSCVCPAWSPDGRWLAYGYRNDGIALRNLRTQTGRILVCQRDPSAQCGGRGALGPGWTPNSEEVSYWSYDATPATLYSVKLTGRHGRFWGIRRPWTGEVPRTEFAADWSPDGRWLVVTIKNAIWKVPVRRSFSRRGAKMLASGQDAVWSPDGKRIAFVSARDGDREIYVMRSDGSHERPLTNNSWADVEPDW
jgi:Tol biopolymer transport system component